MHAYEQDKEGRVRRGFTVRTVLVDAFTTPRSADREMTEAVKMTLMPSKYKVGIFHPVVKKVLPFFT